jgi:hypothetical protein
MWHRDHLKLSGSGLVMMAGDDWPGVWQPCESLNKMVSEGEGFGLVALL